MGLERCSACTAFAEDPSLVSGTHVGQLATACNSRFKKDPMLLASEGTTLMHTNPLRQAHRHINKSKIS